ncbi:hypothetical protein A3F28_03775 [Candidatus Uhrbacteria bacterium RIFCSPHIGHO2_12_FULL_57_11]|uniref:Uncharacterized protein n=1 Tax=Candidatus Uhrbacteria bacterium RIFCSPHIGHO2_12_FULL_57_11 TaxID=1802398 RepID=A0A1F7UI34_9BACT|nr:MAG: hypothetical protein A3F28_03775 [Candidatus Uhrbacteria bacterium RIFCSPHIGHO2_12_FULL_57_11]
MIVYDFASALSRCLDHRTKLKLSSSVVQEQAQALELPTTYEKTTEALRWTIRRLAPGEEKRLFPRGKMILAPSIADALLKTACARTEETIPCRVDWKKSAAHHQKLERVLRAFLEEICGRATDLERARDVQEITTEIIECDLRERFRDDMARWGVLMREPQNLLAVAASISGLGEKEAHRRIFEIMTTLISRTDIPRVEEIVAVVQSDSVTPAAKA